MTHLPRPLVAGMSAAVFAVAFDLRMSIKASRKIIDTSAKLARLPVGTVAEPITLGGRPAERVTVGATERPRAILYLHGGGYVVGSIDAYRNLAAHLAKATEAVVFNLDYRLAPEHQYPAALDDAEAAFRAIVEEHGFAPDRIAISGDSAGGGLAVAVARRLTDAGLRPAALALISPWTDPADENVARSRDMVVNLEWGRYNARLYRGAADPHDPGYAPMHGPLEGLPPTLIHYCKTEMLAQQVERFAQRLRDADVPLQVVQHPRLWHSGHTLAGTLREASVAVQDLGAYLRANLDAVRA